MENEKARFRPYEGGEPYIFASYSHADSETVLPILDALHKRGFRVWYDQGIPWTDEWENVVADHVSRCAVCLAFHSKSTQKSVHCDAELMYARRKNRPILSVYLEDGVELSPGVEMYLTRYQSVKWKDFAGMGAFLDEMERQDAVRDCKIQPTWHYDGGIRWNLSGDGVLTIAARNPSYPAKMPDYDWDRETQKSTAPWMREWENIVFLIIERSITVIGKRAFFDCTKLTRVRIPDSIVKIGGEAFRGCTGLTGVRIPNSVTSIGNFAFYGCTGLTDFTIPDSVATIGEGVFYSCKGLRVVTIPNSVTAISTFAFSDCMGLTCIRIPDSVTEIGGEAFRGCTGLTSMTIPNSVAKIGGEAFRGCTGLTDVTIPDSVIEIGGEAFRDCTGLTSVTIPDSVAKIGGEAFRGCTGLTDIEIADSVRVIGSEAFADCKKMKNITIPSGTSFWGDTFPPDTVITVRK